MAESTAPFLMSSKETPSEYVLASSLTYYWNIGTLTWVKGTQPSAGGGGAVTVADGADVAEGATTDAAVITDTTGTLSGKLRGLVKWAFERMPASLGQKTMAASLPVVISSDQSVISVSGAVTNTVLSVVGGGTEAAAQRVTIANNSTGVLPVTDNGGSLTVDSPQLPGALAAGGGLKIEGVAGGVVVPVSGTVATGGLTDTQLRATPVPVSGTVAVTAASLPLPTGASTNPLANFIPPTFAEAATVQLSADLAGNLRVTDRTNDGNEAIIVDLLGRILTELKVHNTILQVGLNVRDDPDALRQDPYYQTLN